MEEVQKGGNPSFPPLFPGFSSSSYWFYWAASSVFLCVSDLRCFNFDAKNFKVFPGSEEARFGSTVQQHEAGGRQW